MTAPSCMQEVGTASLRCSLQPRPDDDGSMQGMLRDFDPNIGFLLVEPSPNMLRINVKHRADIYKLERPFIVIGEEPLFCLFGNAIISEPWCVKLFLKAINGVLKHRMNKGHFPTNLIVLTS